MMQDKKVICVIPARLKSTRFPQKVLATLRNKPLLQWVWEAACSVPIFDRVVFAIDAIETQQIIAQFSKDYYFTSPTCPSGTDRLVELAMQGVLTADIWVNWQGDEPFITAEMISELLQTAAFDGSDVWTLKKRLAPQEAHNPHIAKVVSDHAGYALYFSRSPIPYYRDAVPESAQQIYKHVGLYAFSHAALQRIGQLAPCSLETAEQLEQLRFLYHNLKVRVHETQHEVFGIDLPEHLAKAEAYLEERNPVNANRRNKSVF